MSDTSVLFYSCLLKPEPFASNVRAKLLKAIGSLPLISVTHKPLAFGQANVSLALPVSTWSLYRQILVGARLATTRFIACSEDDALYNPEHFAFRPPRDDTFYYSRSRWWVEKEGFYRWRKRTVMATCICNRELFIEWAERLFERFPTHPKTREEMTGWSEPGRYETWMKLPQVKIEHFETRIPVLTFNSRPSLGGLRKINESDIIRETLPGWGDAKTLWQTMHS